MTFLPFLLNRSRLPICSCKFFLFWPVPQKSVKKRKKKYICMYIDKQNQLKKKKNYFFLFWPVTRQTLNGSSTVLVSTKKAEQITFLPFLLNRSKLACNTSNT